MATQELNFKISASPDAVKAALASVRAELTQTAQVQKSVSQGELSMRQQIAAAASLQRQRSAALIQDWKAEEAAAAKAQKTIGQGELSLQQQLSAVASLQRQRSAALIADWKKQEAQAAKTAAGIRPFSHDVDRLTDAMRLLSSSTSALQGPMGGIASRISALTSLTHAFSNSGTNATTITHGLTTATTEVAAAEEKAAASVAAYTTSLMEAAGPVGAAILGAVAMAAAVVTVGKALFDATKSAADFKGKMFDLSQQTGVSVETLSALEVMARTTGGSIETITASLGIFQRNLEQAQDPTSKEAKLLKELGVETTNTEEALRQTLTRLAAMPEGFTQTSRALELFGRGGKSMLAILKEMHGDLDGAIDRFRAMGILISTEDARAADEFNDQLVMLEFQLRSMTAVIGTELMPMMLSATKQVSKGVGENKEALQALASIIKLVVEPAVVIFTRVVIDAANVLSFASRGFRMANNTLIDLASGYDLATAAARQYANEASRAAAASLGASGGAEGIGPSARRITPGIDFGTPSMAGGPAWLNRSRGGGGGGGRGGVSDADRAAKDAAKLAERQLDVWHDLVAEANKLKAELNDVNTSTKSWAVQQSILNGVLKDAEPRVQNLAKATAQLVDNRVVQLRLQKEIRTTAEQLKETVRQAIEGDKSHLRIIQEQIEAWENQGAVLKDTTKAWFQIMGGMASVKDTAQAMIPIINSLSEELTKIPLSDATKNVLSDAQVDALGSPAPPPVPIEVIDSWTILKQTSMDAISSMAQGVGSLIQQWVLYGTAGPNALKKMVAAVLAAAAAQAAVEAIMQLAHAAKEYALGIAAASNPFTAAMAPGHFAAAKAHVIAAAVYGAVGGVAAASGRGIAGGAFAAASGGSAEAGTAGRAGSAAGPAAVDVGRRKAETSQTAKDVLEIRFTGNLGDVIETHWVERYNGGGRLRNLVLTDRDA